MKTIAFIGLSAGFAAALLLLGFANEQFGPLGKILLVAIIAAIFPVIGLSNGFYRNQIPSVLLKSEGENIGSDWNSLGKSNWLAEVIDSSAMAKQIATELDRSRRYGRSFTILAVIPDLNRLAVKQIERYEPIQLPTLRLFIQDMASQLLRSTDVISNSANLTSTIILLPETDQNESNVVLSRFRNTLKEYESSTESDWKRSVNISVKAICYPDDATDLVGILEIISDFEEKSILGTKSIST